MEGRSRAILEWAGIGVVGLALLAALGFGIFLLIRPLIPGLQLGGVPSVGSLNRIAYLGLDNNIYVVSTDGKSTQQVTSDAEQNLRRYDFPTWSPDGRRIAFVGYERSEAGINAVVYALPARGGRKVSLYQSKTDPPIYLYWSPDGNQLAFLTATQDGSISLHVVNADGTSQRVLGTGSPFYWSWSPDSRRMVFHTGGSKKANDAAQLSLLDISSSKTSPINVDPAAFNAPVWAKEGERLFFAAEQGNQAALLVSDATNSQPRSLLNFDTAIAFVPSPKGDAVAYILPQQASSVLYGDLNLIGMDGGQGVKVADGPVLSFFWSPDGKHLAYNVASVDQVSGQNQLHLTLYTLDVSSGKASGQPRKVFDFFPAPDYLSTIPYFDQYAQSASFWGPDNRHLVVTQVAQDSSGQTIGEVIVVDGQGSDKPVKVGEGQMAWWSWR